MAVDTASKRFSIMAMKNGFGVLPMPLIIPDGTVSGQDMQHLLVRYAGIAWGAVVAAANTLIEPWNYWRERRLHRTVRPWMGRP